VYGGVGWGWTVDGTGVMIAELELTVAVLDRIVADAALGGTVEQREDAVHHRLEVRLVSGRLSERPDGTVVLLVSVSPDARHRSDPADAAYRKFWYEVRKQVSYVRQRDQRRAERFARNGIVALRSSVDPFVARSSLSALIEELDGIVGNRVAVDIVVMHYLYGMPWVDVADAQGITAANARQLSVRARRAIRIAFRDVP
jgi:hypothetical protein